MCRTCNTYTRSDCHKDQVPVRYSVQDPVPVQIPIRGQGPIRGQIQIPISGQAQDYVMLNNGFARSGLMVIDIQTPRYYIDQRSYQHIFNRLHEVGQYQYINND
jgi:hypothetical protein